MHKKTKLRIARQMVLSSRRESFRLGGLMLLVSLCIVVLGYVTFEQHRRDIERSVQNNLAGIADLKASQILQWRKQRLDDALILTRNTKIVPVFEQWLRDGAPANAERQWLASRLNVMRHGGNYTSLSLLDATGMPRLDLDGPAHAHPERQQQALLVMRNQQVLMSDLHLNEAGQPEIDLIAPLLREDQGRLRAVGALHFQIDPARFLFPLIQSWPVQSATAETLLVRREGEQVLFLNQLRHRADAAMTLRLPLADTALPAARAVQGGSGFISGKDYRGDPVVAYMRQLPEAGWSIVAKINESEIYAPVRQLALWSGGITFLLLGAGFALFWLQMRRAQLDLRNQQLQQEKRALDRRFEDLSRFANDIFLLADADDHIVEVNTRAEEVYGYTRQELLRMKGADLRMPQEAGQHEADWHAVLTQGHANYETVHRCKNGTPLYVDVSARVLHLDHGRFVQIILRDISARKQAEARLHYLAYYDDLTGLPNRTLYIDHLRQAMVAADRRERLVGIMFLDLDSFKNVNDTLGHEAGNRLLRQVADLLKTCFREGDTVARMGGDEFAVVLADMSDVNDAIGVAQKILKSFEAPFDVDGHELYVNFSIGITLYPFDDGDHPALLRNADSAMYLAKSKGGRQFQFYSAELTRRAHKRLLLETGLRHALERHEFLLHYQPQVDLKTGLVTGVEALVRWERPGQGMVSPAEFIPVAEETGLIVPLGEWILRTACAQARAWQAQGLPKLIMAVNLSARQFLPGNHLVEQVQNILAQTGLAPDCLEFEITESVLIDEADTSVLDILREFKRMGIVLAIDDFGTGYSSLSYLRRFPIDKLKIDQSFVRGITDNPEDASLVQTIIAMARSLNLTVIAEGVETEEQHDHLHHHDCDQMQGYFFSRPVSAEQISDLLRACHGVQAGARGNTQLPLQFP